MTSSDSLAAPDDFLALTASPSMTMQNGQPVVMASGSRASASSTRLELMRVPVRSSSHIRAPPAPQQKPLPLHRRISAACTPGTDSITWRGWS